MYSAAVARFLRRQINLRADTLVTNYLKMLDMRLLWSAIATSDCVVSGSFLQRLTTISPSFGGKSSFPDFHLSDLDIYLDPDATGDLWLILKNVYGFTNIGENPNVSGTTYITRTFGDKLFRINVILTSDAPQTVRDYDLQYLSMYYTSGTLHIVNPVAFLLELPLMGTSVGSVKHERCIKCMYSSIV